MTRSAAIIALILVAGPASAQPVNLAEKVAAGDRAKFTIELDLKGEMILVQDGQKESIPLTAKARHAFAERVLAVRRRPGAPLGAPLHRGGRVGERGRREEQSLAAD